MVSFHVMVLWVEENVFLINPNPILDATWRSYNVTYFTLNFLFRFLIL